MQKAQVLSPSRRGIMVGAIAAAATPGAMAAGELAMTDFPAAEGTPGPGKILVWVDEGDWRAMIASAVALSPVEPPGPASARPRPS